MDIRRVAGVDVSWPAHAHDLVEPIMRFAPAVSGGSAAAPGLHIDLARHPQPPPPGEFVATFFHGAVQASVATDGRMLLHDVTGVSELVVAADGGSITGWATATGERACVQFGWTTLFMALTIALRRCGFLHLHAGALVDPAGRGTVLVVGDAGSGKTTTSLLLAAGGWSLAGDDATFVARGGRCFALTRPLHVGARTLAAFPELEPFVPDEAADPVVSGRGKQRLRGQPFRAWAGELPTVDHMLFPQVVDGPSAIEPLETGAALERLVASSGLLTSAEAVSGAWGLASLERLARGARCHRLLLGADALVDRRRVPELVSKPASVSANVAP